VTGAFTLEGAPAPPSAGAGVPAERTLELPAGATLVLDMPGGARVVLTGPAKARLGRDRLRQLLLAQGEAHVQLAPEGATRRLSLRVATPEQSFELAGRAEAWVGVAAGEGSYFGLAAGAATADSGGATQDERAGVDLTPGQALVATAGSNAPPKLEKTERTIDAIAAQGRSALVRLRGSAGQGEAIGRALSEVLAELDALRLEGEQLTQRQRAAKDNPDKAEAQLVQQALVSYAQRLYRLRRRALTLWERRQVEALRDGTASALADQATRVRALIGAVDS
jgi:hypothetical protein